jgi:hypothetical protein
MSAHHKLGTWANTTRKKGGPMTPGDHIGQGVIANSNSSSEKDPLEDALQGTNTTRQNGLANDPEG